MKKFYLLFVVFFSFIFINLTFASVPKGITLHKTSDGYTISFNLPSYQVKVIEANGENFYNIEVPDFGVVNETGLPALPQLSFNMFIPYNDDHPSLDVIRVNSEIKELKQKIYPFQQPWEKNNNFSDRPFTIDRNYYNSTGKTYPAVDISEPFIINGVKGIIVTIHPFNYNPIENKLTVINSGEFKLNLNNSVSPVSGKSRTFNNFFKDIFANYEYTTERAGGNYLIITAPSYEADIAPFAAYKSAAGFTVDVFNTGATGTTNTAIKAFIQQRYDNAATRPDFILLVGDVANIPAWTGSGADNPTTDLNYVQLEGSDYFADAFIGRFSVANTTQLGNAISKSTFMESYVGTLDQKNVFMASSDNYTISEGTHNYVINTYFDPAGYTNLKLYSHTYGATTTQLINALNDNQVFAIYSGHGSETSWADGPPLSQSQVNALTNTWYPYVYSFACLTGSFENGECFGETWLRTAHGAASFYGSSVTSYWDEDDILERNVIKAMFEDDLTRVTPMFVQGMIYLVDHYGGINSTTLRYMEMYNLMGDPSLPVVETAPLCPVEVAGNPGPEDGATDVSINLSELTWTNGSDATANETYFGTNPASLELVQSGTLANSWTIDPVYLPLNYFTKYYWKVVEVGDTCSSPITFSFKTIQDPNLVSASDTIRPQSVNYWTGTSNSTTKTDNSEIRTVMPELGWMNFDISNIPDEATIISVSFNGYVNATNYPYWSATPMGSVNPVTDGAGAIYSQVSNNAAEGVAYIYSDESSSFAAGWHSYPMESSITEDLQNALQQDWFAVGIFDRDVSSTYYINFDGWNETHPPYLVVNYEYVTPVELTSFDASVKDGNVILNWATATETNNRGFEIQRKSESGEYSKVGYVPGFGTSSEPKTYSYSDGNLEAGIYTYRLKQVDFNGAYNYSNEINANVVSPIEYTLEQNYPNPFNPGTTIKYSIPKDGFVKLKVYNLLGQEIISLVNNIQRAGRYEVTFDAARFASGVYYYCLETKNYTSMKKMILIK
jgi:Peptidase family C25/Propeptide_C25/Secretion system C-terminal sorting domain